MTIPERVRFARGRRDLTRRLPPVLLRLPIDESPTIRVEASELFLKREECPGVVYRGFDLQPVSDDPRIQDQLLNSFPGIPCDFFRIELADQLADKPPVF